MTLTISENVESLKSYLAQQLQADSVTVIATSRLSGGAIQENWLVDVSVTAGLYDGVQEFVLRTDSPSSVAVSHSRPQEYQLIKAAYDEGVTVPKPILLCEDLSIIGRPFYIMERISGSAIGTHIVRKRFYQGDMEALATRLGREMATIHKMTPATHQFSFLKAPNDNPGLAEINRFRAYLNALNLSRPVLEIGLRYLEKIASPWEYPVLAHHDFRTGNYMVDEAGLTGVLDWEFAGWSDPHEDMGWFQAMCWRFGARDKPAGGVGSLASFYAGYGEISNLIIDESRVRFWEIFAHIRWGVIALQQADRHISGEENSLNLALTGRMLPEMEYEILSMLGGDCDDPSDRVVDSPDAPDGKNLLETTASLLKEKVLPTLEGEARFATLMAINAIGISMREISESIEFLDLSGLCQEIRRGEYDAGDKHNSLLSGLMIDVQNRLKISNPSYLNAAENQF